MEISPLAVFWVHNIDPFVIKFPPNPIIEGIRWYGIAYLLGFVVAACLLNFYHKKGRLSLNSDQQITLLTSLFIGVLVGGRLGYVLFYDLQNALQHPGLLINFHGGGIRGMSSHGGFIGVILAALWFSKRARIAPLQLGDALVTLAPPGLLFGRIANFINGELWGRITDVPWAVIFPQSCPYLNYPQELIPARHPSQLYEAALEGLLLLIFTQWRFWKKPKSQTPGRLCGEFFIAYGLVRIFVECFREPDAPLIAALTRGQFYSIFIILTGIFFIFISREKR
ncbi:MAG: prolipoprotein diacylglyceryl transferase [Verrucomicrobia bacterium GWC2_42_7]|nr:MAG: prolipoprotein diacylglyceryl transferase [Verrucomicrobia bacterium GWC2_42_7]